MLVPGGSNGSPATVASPFRVIVVSDAGSDDPVTGARVARPYSVTTLLPLVSGMILTMRMTPEIGVTDAFESSKSTRVVTV